MRKSRAAGSGGGILVVGVDRLLTGLARCCKPAPPDPIAGFVTRGKGVTIHRASCVNVTRMRATQPERLISADWGAPRDEVFPVDIVVEAMDRQGLLRDISEVLSREKINVTAANTLTRNMHTRMAFTVEVQSLAVLKRALALVADVPGVTARRGGAESPTSQRLPSSVLLCADGTIPAAISGCRDLRSERIGGARDRWRRRATLR